MLTLFSFFFFLFLNLVSALLFICVICFFESGSLGSQTHKSQTRWLTSTLACITLCLRDSSFIIMFLNSTTHTRVVFLRLTKGNVFRYELSSKNVLIFVSCKIDLKYWTLEQILCSLLACEIEKVKPSYIQWRWWISRIRVGDLNKQYYWKLKVH